MISDPRTLRIVAMAVAGWLLLGWAWSDDWLWTLARAVGVTAFCIGAAGLYAEANPLARVGRVAVGTALGGLCASSLGGDGQAVLIVAGVFLAVLLGCEYLIGRDVRRVPSAN